MQDTHCLSWSRRLAIIMLMILFWFTNFIVIFLTNGSIQKFRTTISPPNIWPPRTTPPVTQKISTEIIFNSREEKSLIKVRQELSSLPIDCWQYSFQSMHKNKNCAPLPNLAEIEFNSIYWQVIYGNNTRFSLYSSYDNGDDVRLLGVHDNSRLKLEMYCQLWFNETGPPSVVKIDSYTNLWTKIRNESEYQWQPYLVTIGLPKYRKLGPPPVALSLTLDRCARANTLLTVYSKGLLIPKLDFAVCLPGLDSPHIDLSDRLVIWLELLRLLGAQHVFVYKLHVHTNMSSVLDYYKHMRYVTVTPTTLPAGQPNLPSSLQHLYLQKKRSARLQSELIHLNDCLYRSKHQYRWILALGLDEVILPMLDKDWHGLLNRVRSLQTSWFKSSSTSSYEVRNQRRNLVKAFHDTEKVLAVHSEVPLVCREDCNTKTVPLDVAILMKFSNGTLLQLCQEQSETTNEELLRLCQKIMYSVEAALASRSQWEAVFHKKY